MESLWRIDEKLVKLFEEIAEAGGELTPEAEQKLSELEGDRKKKVQNLCYFIRAQEAVVAACKKEVEHFQALARARANTAERLKAYLLNEMRYLGEEKIQTETVAVTRCKPGVPSFRLKKGVELKDLPPEWVEVVPESLKLNLAGVKAALSGEVPDEAGTFEVDRFVVTKKERLLIK